MKSRKHDRMAPGRSRCRVARRSAFVDGTGFKDSRILAGLDRPAAARLLGVTTRTVRNWETSRCRVPYAAFKLMRLLHGTKLCNAWATDDSAEIRCTHHSYARWRTSDRKRGKFRMPPQRRWIFRNESPP